MKRKHENTENKEALFFAEIEDGWATMMYYDAKDFFYKHKFRDGKILNEVLEECEIEYT